MQALVCIFYCLKVPKSKGVLFTISLIKTGSFHELLKIKLAYGA